MSRITREMRIPIISSPFDEKRYIRFIYSVIARERIGDSCDASAYASRPIVELVGLIKPLDALISSAPFPYGGRIFFPVPKLNALSASSSPPHPSAAATAGTNPSKCVFAGYFIRARAFI